MYLKVNNKHCICMVY